MVTLQEQQWQFDEITGLPTEAYFAELLDQTWVACEGEPFVIVAFDLRGFGRFVEQYGEKTAQECVRRTTQTVESMIPKPGCRMSRYGPGRFLVMLPGFDADEGRILVRHLERSIADLELSLSLTVQLVSGSVYDGVSGRDLLNRAVSLLDARSN